ncbi:MAG TPA: YfiR family protein [Acidobacteriota bacterium]
MFKQLIKRLGIIILFLVTPHLSFAQDFEYKVKAEFLERFTRFIEWPDDSPLNNPDKPFCICVAGKNPFGSYLEEMAGQVKIKGKAVEIHQIEELPKELPKCQILFIAQSEKDKLGDILKLTDGKPILTVGDTDGFAEDGVLLNFFTSGNYIRFEVNIDRAEKSKLKFSSRLLKLAKLV